MMGWIIKLKTQISLIDVDSIDSMVILSTSDPSVTFGPLTFDPNFGQGETCNQSERMIGIASHWVSCWVPGFSCFLHGYIFTETQAQRENNQHLTFWRLFKIIQDYSRKQSTPSRLCFGFSSPRLSIYGSGFRCTGLDMFGGISQCVQKWGGRCSTETRSTKASGMVQKPVKQHSTGHGFTFSIVFPSVSPFL